MEKTKQLVIYEVTRTSTKDKSEQSSTTYHLIKEHAKIAEERDILKSKLDIKQDDSAKYRVKYAEHTITIPRREYIVTGNQLDQLLKDIKRGKVECGGFKNPATLDFDNTQNERTTLIEKEEE